MESTNVENLSSDESLGRDKRKSPPVVQIENATKKSKTTSSNKATSSGNTSASKKTGASKKKGGSKKPSVWVDFEKFVDEDEKQKARCKHCSAELAAHPRLNGTSALRRHVLICEQHPDYMKNQSNIFLKKNDDVEGGSCEVKSWKFDAEACDRAVTEMVILDELPFSFVERVGFRRFCQTLNPNYKPPSRTTIGRNTGNLYLEEKVKLKSFFANSNRRICLTTDTWTSIQNVNYMSVTAHFIDDNWVLHNRVINFKDITSHKGEDIGRALIQCLKEWDIENILTITADNASANNTAIDFVKDRLDNLLGDGRYVQVRCMAHIINLIVKDGLRDGATPIERIRNAIRFIRQSPKRLDAFKKCVKEERIESKALLCLDMPTRWNSTFDMLDRAEKFEKAFQAFDLAHPSFKNDLSDGLPKITDWSYARKIRDLLGLFKIKTTNASATKRVTINMCYSEIMDIYRHLREMRGTDIQSKLMADNMQDKSDKYWGTTNKGFNYIIYFTAILDPRLKLRVLSFGFEEVFRAEKKKETDDELKERIEKAVSFITDELEIVFKQYEYELNRERPSSSQASQRASKVAGPTDGSSSFYAQFKASGGSSSYETKKELQKYLDDKEEPDYAGFDILQWWKASSSKYPIVAKMAKDILAIPVSSVASESAFSTGGRVVDPYRSSLTPSIVEALICTGDWIGTSSKKITNETPTDFDDIGKEIYEKAEPGNMNPGV